MKASIFAIIGVGVYWQSYSTYFNFASEIIFMKAEKRSNCPISYCLDFVGDKWTLLIMRDILMAGKKYFKEFSASEEGIASNLLASRLKMLVQAGFLESEVDAQRRNMKVYRATQKGRDLFPIIVDMMVWSSKYGDFGPDQERLESFARQVEQDRDAILSPVIDAPED